MATTKNTIGKKKAFKFKKAGNITKNSGFLEKKTLDLSKFKFSLTIPQMFYFLVLIVGLTWFFAAEWRFDTRSVELKKDVDIKLEQFRTDINTQHEQEINDLSKKVEDMEKLINNLNKEFENLKKYNSYLK